MNPENEFEIRIYGSVFKNDPYVTMLVSYEVAKDLIEKMKTKRGLL